jgi:polyphosphate kinase
VHIPSQVPRFVARPAPAGQQAFALLEDVIRLHLPGPYHGYAVLACHAIRVTRDADFTVPRLRAEDLLSAPADTVKARVILPDGTSARAGCDGRPGVRSQERLYEVTGRPARGAPG